MKIYFFKSELVILQSEINFKSFASLERLRIRSFSESDNVKKVLLKAAPQTKNLEKGS